MDFIHQNITTINLILLYVVLAFAGTMPDPKQRPIDFYGWFYDAIHVGLNRLPAKYQMPNPIPEPEPKAKSAAAGS